MVGSFVGTLPGRRFRGHSYGRRYNNRAGAGHLRVGRQARFLNSGQKDRFALNATLATDLEIGLRHDFVTQPALDGIVLLTAIAREQIATARCQRRKSSFRWPDTS